MAAERGVMGDKAPNQVDTMAKHQIRALIDEVAEVLQEHIYIYRWLHDQPSRAERGHLYRARNFLLSAELALAFGYAQSFDSAITHLDHAVAALRAVGPRHSLADLEALFPPF